MRLSPAPESTYATPPISVETGRVVSAFSSTHSLTSSGLEPRVKSLGRAANLHVPSGLLTQVDQRPDAGDPQQHHDRDLQTDDVILCEDSPGEQLILRLWEI